MKKNFKKSLVQKKVWSKEYFWTIKLLSLEKNCGPKNFLISKLISQKKINEPEKKFGPKEMFGPKKFLVQKKFWSKNNFWSKRTLMTAKKI